MTDIIRVFTERIPVISMNNEIERFIKSNTAYKVVSVKTKVNDSVVVVTVHLTARY